jgi:hypothetical protein
MNITKPIRIAGVMLAWTLASASNAAAPAHPCAGQYDDQQRLACYDAAFGKPVRPPGAPPSSAIARPSAVPPSQPVSAAPPGKSVAREAQEDTPFSATITALSRPMGRRFVATLDNGQKWTQLEPDDKFQIAVGDAITIQPGVVGSHFLVTRSAGKTRVTLNR